MDCWNDETGKTVEDMQRHLVKYPLMENHLGKILEQLLFNIEGHYKNCLEIGCGTAQNAELIKVKYAGMDLPYVINNLTKRLHPTMETYQHDINNFEDVRNEIIGKFDLILTSAFIDVMEHPIEVLTHILSHAKKYVIVHRQEIDWDAENTRTKVIKNNSHGGWTYHSIISLSDLYKVMEKTGFAFILISASLVG